MKSGYFKRIASLGLTVAEFTRRSGISFHTLQRMDAKDPNVRDSTKARAERTLRAFEQELYPPRAISGGRP